MITFEKYASTWEGFIFKSGKLFPSTGMEQLSQFYYKMTSQQFMEHYNVPVDYALLSKGAIYVNDNNIQIGMIAETPTDDQIRLIKEYLEGKGFPGIEVSGVWYDPQTFQLNGEKLLYHGEPENFMSVLNTTISQGYNYNTPNVTYEWLDKKSSKEYYTLDELPYKVREQALMVTGEDVAHNIEGTEVWYFTTMPVKKLYHMVEHIMDEDQFWLEDYPMDELIDDIKKNGIQVPIVIGPMGVEGMHRLYAAKIAGLVEVPVLQYKIINKDNDEVLSSIKFSTDDNFIPTSDGYMPPEDIVDNLTYLNYAYNRDIMKPNDEFKIEIWRQLFGDAVYKYERHYQYELQNGTRPRDKRPDWLDRPTESSLKFADIIEDMLDPKSDDIELLSYSHYGLPLINYDGCEYALATDEMADDAASIAILESAQCFTSWFLQNHLHGDLSTETIELIQQSRGAEDAIKGLIKDQKEFVDDAVSSDGRGHFISGYDGDEKELLDIGLTIEALSKDILNELHITRAYTDTIYVYRIN